MTGTSKYINLIAACMVVINQGNIFSFNSWQNKLKDLYHITQTQVELIGSAMLLCMESGLIGGLVLENCGSACAGILSLLLGGLGYAVLFVLSYYPSEFGAEWFFVLVIVFGTVGIGIGITYIQAYTISLHNFEHKHRGKISLALTLMVVIPWSLSSYLASSVLSYNNLLIYFFCIQLLASNCAIFFLKRGKMEDDSSEQVTNGNNDADAEMEELDELVNEKSRLTENVKEKREDNKTNKGDVENDAEEKSKHGDIFGLEIMKKKDFWSFVVFFLCSMAIHRTFYFNLGTYLRSFNLENATAVLTTSAPVIALVTKLIVAPLSDAFYGRIPRISFLMLPTLLKLGFLIAFLSHGDKLEIIILTTYSIFAAESILFLLCPVLFSEYFGTKYFARNYGSCLLGVSCLSVLLKLLLGAVYDSTISAPGAINCKGLDCFYESTMALIILTAVALVAAISLLIANPPKMPLH